MELLLEGGGGRLPNAAKAVVASGGGAGQNRPVGAGGLQSLLAVLLEAGLLPPLVEPQGTEKVPGLELGAWLGLRATVGEVARVAAAGEGVAAS